MFKRISNRHLRLIGAVAFLVVAVGGSEMLTSNRCVVTARADAVRLDRLEDEIDFRREALLDALEQAHTKSDIDAAEDLLTTSSPSRFPEMKGIALLDISETYDRLRRDVTVEQTEGGDGSYSRPNADVDPWLLSAYPVDEVGFLYGSSPEQLETLRLAARQQLARFRARRLFEPLKTSDLEPDCSIGNTLAFILSGGESVVFRIRGRAM